LEKNVDLINRARRSLVGSVSAFLKQAGVQFSARQPREVFPTVLISDGKMEGTMYLHI
jgi:hypothetical protein